LRLPPVIRSRGFKQRDASHRVADNPRISKSIDLERTTTRYPCGAYFKSPEMSLRFANAGVGVHRKKGRLGFWGNLGGGWVVARRGCGFGEKCGVVALRKDRGTNTRKPEPRKWPAWKAGEGWPRLTAYPKGWRSLADVRGCGFCGKAAERMPGNLNCGNSRRGKLGRDCRS